VAEGGRVTRFEELLLERIDSLTTQVGGIATTVARLEERQKGQDARLEDLEEAPVVRHAAPASARRRGWRENGGLYLSNAAIAAIVTALLTFLGARPAAAPPAPHGAVPVEATK
jgi:hypothetical protein